MRSMVWRRFFLMLALGPALGACMTSPTQRFVGIAPVLDADAVERSSGKIDRVMAALARDAGGGSMYDVTEAGFNYVDDRCMEYFSELFYLNRRKDAAKAGIGAFDKTSSAILLATGASSLTMGVIAQAFGLASNLADIAAGTYLYQLPPATTLSFVKKLQGAYRDAVSAKRGQIQTPATAYHIIQEYLSLCLPPVIEAKLVEHVADANASPGRGSSVSNIEISVGTDRVDPPARREVVTVIQRSDERVTKPVAPDRPSWAKNALEAGLAAREIGAFQRQLCLPESGRIDDTTRAAMDEFFTGVQESDPSRAFRSVREAGLTASQRELLRKAVRLHGGICDPSKGENAKTIGSESA
jgi:hypothetical protein